ncbi:putative pentatricopeptide repeat-containing protein At5g06400, mitochondrial [Olea europaea var. sylvestris]|uniref:putative pentatricopeptide repeat-containing protein At5g06400, mitochondrial n=1 Tax=Olea europaea var. sylvestris TaxID=158386 RepID=UPI000C1D4429|nr:putative pentatricopeptide repeat-containing protein At5g06400, mitochondrial [Olea europaea var. sylvestris]XP_022875869.1 putative pentatricopeptide repeat-containing protein At5g06400, mitochondrial [Olea europaea var. sylvestris]
MNLRHFFSRQTINNISKLNGRVFPRSLGYHRHCAIIASRTSPSICSPESCGGFYIVCSPKSNSHFGRLFHTAQLNHSYIDLETESDDNATTNEFLSRFVWRMRQKLSEAYTDCDKKTIDGMLLIIVRKVVSEMERGSFEQMVEASSSAPSQDFSEDLWRTVWEVSHVVLEDMEKERKKEKMKGFLQSEEVKDMCRFAGEVGIRGDMLRELRFKWAREKMEESEFYQSLEKLRKMESQTEAQQEPLKTEFMGEVRGMKDNNNEAEEKPNVVELPKRHGKIKYKIYGLDLSDPTWAEAADKIHESGEAIWPQEPKQISGKCELVDDKILSLQEDDDPAPLLAEWKELLQPSRIDWINLLDRLKEQRSRVYFKIAEFLLSEESFQTNIRDYSKLIDGCARENCLEDAERILKKMNENGILPDILTSTIMVSMYSKSGNLDRAKEAFENLRSHGFQPDMKVYISMIMAYVNAGQPKMGESLMREMEARDMKPTKEIFMALLQSFAQRVDVNGALRISSTMQFAGFQPSLESCTLLVETFGQDGDPDQARHNFDYMMKLGHKPDDRCTASMIAAYGKKNFLDKALDLLLELEKDGFEPGIATYTVLVDWLAKLLLVDEAEQILDKIAMQGEAAPLQVHISLCDMYSRAGSERKALQALGVLESKKDQLRPKEFERVINSLLAGGFLQDARRIQGLMEAQGFQASEPLKIALMASQAVGRKRRTIR